MSSGADRRVDSPNVAPAHLQPGTRREIKIQKATEHLDRLLGDSELLLRLQLSGYADKEWRPVATEFARYGLGILSAWLATGQIFREVRAMTGIRLLPHEAGFDADARNDLANRHRRASPTGAMLRVLGGAWRVPAYWPGGVRHGGDVSLIGCSWTEREKAHPRHDQRRFCW